MYIFFSIQDDSNNLTKLEDIKSTNEEPEELDLNSVEEDGLNIFDNLINQVQTKNIDDEG